MSDLFGTVQVRPALKWAGGKRELLSQIRPHYAGMNPGKYVEPFFGGGAVYFDVLAQLGIQHAETAVTVASQRIAESLRHVVVLAERVVRNVD